jgi:hypothetical protein
MTRIMGWLIAGMALGVSIWLPLGGGAATGQNEPWQPILSMEVYQELAKREAELIQDLLKDTPKKLALNRARFGAVLIAALALSVKQGSPAEDLRGTRGTALLLAKALGNKDQLAVARKLAAQLANAKADPDAKMDNTIWAMLMDAPTLMVHFLPKNEGGDGIYPDLQRTTKLQGAKNGILEKIRDLTTTELSAADIKRGQRAGALRLPQRRDWLLGLPPCSRENEG